MELPELRMTGGCILMPGNLRYNFLEAPLLSIPFAITEKGKYSKDSNLFPKESWVWCQEKGEIVFWCCYCAEKTWNLNDGALLIPKISFVSNIGLMENQYVAIMTPSGVWRPCKVITTSHKQPNLGKDAYFTEALADTGGTPLGRRHVYVSEIPQLLREFWA